ncbi:MAG: T9SS type A sorting domain-containing protein [Dysgonomonas sp.]|nr:T9SS type A sorting domain-containing protein [Dysgonomonas sp.]
MKKLLLVLCGVLFVCCGVFGQDVKSLSGPTTVSAKSVHRYTLYFTKALDSNTKFCFEVIHGYFGKQNGTISVKKEAYTGDTFVNIDVYWADVEITGAYLCAYKESHSGNKVYLRNIKVTKDGSGASGGSVEGNIEGPIILYSSEIGKYSLEVETSDQYVWIFDSKFLDRVNNKSNYYYSKEEYFQAKNIYGVEKTKIRAYTLDAAGNTKNLSDFIVTLVGTPVIQSASKNICNDESVSYTLEHLEYFPNATISWQASTNMTLVSGQGTSNATFKGISGGSAEVKAIVNYNGKEYIAENSNVWVGRPTTPTISCNGGTRLSPNSSYVLTAKAGVADRYTWNNGSSDYSLDATTTTTNENGMRTGYGSPGMSSMGIITCEATNMCGTSAAGRIRLSFTAPAYKSMSVQEVSEPTPISVKIYSFPTGRLVYQDKKAIDFNINNTGLKKGIYFIEKTDDSGNTTTEKVMKTD